MHAVLVVDAWPENHESALGRGHAVGSFETAKLERVALANGRLSRAALRKEAILCRGHVICHMSIAAISNSSRMTVGC